MPAMRPVAEALLEDAVERDSIARVRHAAATTLVGLATMIAVVSVVVPTWIVHLASPSKTAALRA